MSRSWVVKKVEWWKHLKWRSWVVKKVEWWKHLKWRKKDQHRKERQAIKKTIRDE